MKYYTNGKYCAFIRTRGKDMRGNEYLIVGWKDRAKPQCVYADDFFREYTELKNREQQPEKPGK